jgi:PleD family two-component response regulator
MMSHQGAAQVTLTEPHLTEPEPNHAPLTEGADPAAKRILIVDDEPNIRSFIGRALAGAGYLTDFAWTW